MSLLLNGKTTELNSTILKETEFLKIRHMVYDYCGINLHEGKEALVRGRLMKRLRALHLSSFEEYLSYLENDSTNQEFILLVDILTTNKTSFFRENSHFDFIEKNVMPNIGNTPVKWWSAGCSTGEEPLTLSMTLKESLNTHNTPPVKILATDISTRVIKYAKEGVYTKDKLKDVPDFFIKKYFNKKNNDENRYSVKEEIKKIITYGGLNLLEPWPIRGPFQIIMCRNVMIYFDKKTQNELVERFYDILSPGGYLFLGHSESVSNKEIGLRTVQPAAYQKIRM